MNRRGFFIMEAVVGMVLLAAIAAAVAATLHMRNEVHHKADARARAADRAEAALISLQNGRRARPAELTDVTIESLQSRAPSASRWVRVSAAQDEQRVELIGLVPQEAQP